MAGIVADRVIVELEAKLDKYEANVRRAEQKFDAATKGVQASARQMESAISKSSLQAGSSIRALAGTFAAAFTLNRVKEFADGYTRFTNQLKVAGVEGDNLGRTQEKLFTIAQKYGVELESLGTLYSRSSQVSKELGASQSDLIKFTTGVSAALKIQGTSTTEARGALLQLSQLLATGVVRSEEFNSVNEGALPILKAVAANIDAAGGSVGRLKVLVNNGKVTSQEFFNAFLKGSADLQAQAEKSALTIGNSFIILNNAIGKYIGETDSSLSATERVSGAIVALSNNLDTVVKALGLIGAILLGRFVAGMVAASAATGVVSAAIFAMEARAVGAATTMEALAFASAGAGRSMLAAFGGPVGLAVAALAVGIYYLVERTGEAEQASASYVDQQNKLKAIQDKVAGATDVLSTATGKAREQAIANAKAVREETLQYLANAKAALLAAQAKARQAKQNVVEALSKTDPRTTAGFAQAMAGAGGSLGGAIPLPNPGVVQTTTEDRNATANLRAAEANVKGAEAAVAKIDKILKAPPPVRAPALGKTTKPKKGPKGPKPKDPDEIARKFEDDLARMQLDFETANADAVGSAEARRTLENSRIRAEEAATARAINADKDYSDAQKKKLLALNKQVAEARVDAGRAQHLRDFDEQNLALRMGDLSTQEDMAQLQSNLASSVKDKLAAELRIIDLQEQEEKLRLEAIRDNTTLNEAEREAARRRLAALPQLYAGRREETARQNEGVAAKYLRGLKSTDINEELDAVRVRGLQALGDSITDVTAKIFKMGGVFGDVANQIISDLIRIAVQKTIIQPLADLLWGGKSSSSGGNGIGAIVASLVHGRASGGHVSAGQIYRVNERPGGVEGFQPAGSGKIIPLGRMNRTAVDTGGSGGGGDIYMPITVSAPGANAHTVALIRQTISDAAPALVQAAQRATLRSISRKRMN